MKKVLSLCLFFIFYFLSLNPSFASESWVIERFSSDIAIQNDGRVLVEEGIDVDFNTLEKHGIYRDIPYIYTNKDGSKHYTRVDVKRVLRDGQNERFEKLNEGDFIRIKIGDPNKTISSKHKYLISYVAEGVLMPYEDYDEFYWNVTGFYWDVPIRVVSANVWLPTDSIKQIACYEGFQGSTKPCQQKNINGFQASFSSRDLNTNEGLTVSVGYQKGLVPIIRVPRPKTFFERFFEPQNILVFLVSLVSGVGIIFMIWYKNGRDYWSGLPLLLSQGISQAKIKPIGAKETIVVEYEPPDKLPPAIVGTVMDERADTLDVSATIIDLATRGYLSITEQTKKWIFGSTDYIFKHKGKDTSKLYSYERLLINSLFETGVEVRMSRLRRTFYDELAEVKKQLYSDVMKLKLFVENPESTRTKYIIIFIGVLVACGVLFFLQLENGSPFIAAISAGLMGSGLVGFIFSGFMPRRTANGRELYRRIRGYRLFMSGAEKYKQRFFEKKNMFNEILPYAIVFGLTLKFAQAMKDMGLRPDTAGWYYGATGFNAATFGSNINSFSSSMSSAIASTPGGSGSGGGGSSGGGFGGGGGGSW